MAHRHDPSHLGTSRRSPAAAALMGLALASTTAATLALTAAPAAAAGALTVPGVIDAITQPLADGTMWALISIQGGEAMYHVNVKTHRLIGAEQVSNRADDIALSSNGATVALGTTAGAYPAEIWYNAKTGHYTASARSPQPVYRVATNAAGNIIYALRGVTGSTGSQRMLFAVGTANREGLPYSLPVSAADLAPEPSTDGMLILQPNGTVGHLNFNGGVYVNQFETGAPARSMVLSADASTLYVLRAETSTSTTDTIVEVNVARGTVTKVLNVNEYCAGIALSPDGHTLYEALNGAKSTIRAVSVS